MRAGALAWIGTLGPPAAWFVQHIGGWATGLAKCPDNADGPDWNVPVHGVTLVLGIATAAIVVLCEVASVLAWRATRDADDSDAPPAGRIHFLSVIGMTIGPLFLAIIVMSSAGALVANGCVQS
jgi:hypothetical protein